uniref:RGS domain-containing protein n=1 Tax=Syphacia muris TaxID=451379 RepID=A0A0N5AQL4_9BILA
MCEAARSLSALTLSTCPDVDFDCFQSTAAVAYQSNCSERATEKHPKVAITLVDCSSDPDDSAAETSKTVLYERPQFHLEIPSILTSSHEDEGDDSDDCSQDEVDQRFLHASETRIPTSRRGSTTEKLITRLRRSASFTSPYKVVRRLSQDSTSVERKPTILTRTLSFIKSKMEFASTSTLYPSKDEIRQWQQSFDSLLHHKYGCLVFRDFLKTEFSVENIDFWMSCEEFKKLKEGKKSTLQKAQMIYKQYIEVDSPNEINIDAKVRAATKAAVDEGAKLNTFSLAQAQIEQLMAKDSYSRFVRSEQFQKLLE